MLDKKKKKPLNNLTIYTNVQTYLECKQSADIMTNARHKHEKKKNDFHKFFRNDHEKINTNKKFLKRQMRNDLIGKTDIESAM